MQRKYTVKCHNEICDDKPTLAKVMALSHLPPNKSSVIHNQWLIAFQGWSIYKSSFKIIVDNKI